LLNSELLCTSVLPQLHQAAGALYSNAQLCKVG